VQGRRSQEAASSTQSPPDVVKEGILHVKLVDRLGTRSSKAEDDAYRGRLDNGAECFVVVDAVALREAANHPNVPCGGQGNHPSGICV